MERSRWDLAPKSSDQNNAPEKAKREENESPQEEWRIEKMRSSGPGGQNVQKTESKIRARWYFINSATLSQEEKEKLLRTHPKGYIEAVSQKTRSQHQNLANVKKIIANSRDKALIPPKKRIHQVPPISIKEKRLAEKHRASEKKDRRKKIKTEE